MEDSYKHENSSEQDSDVFIVISLGILPGTAERSAEKKMVTGYFDG